jgi:biotin carboxylase
MPAVLVDDSTVNVRDIFADANDFISFATLAAPFPILPKAVDGVGAAWVRVARRRRKLDAIINVMV